MSVRSLRRKALWWEFLAMSLEKSWPQLARAAEDRADLYDVLAGDLLHYQQTGDPDPQWRDGRVR